MNELIHLFYVDSNPADRKKVRQKLQNQPVLFDITAVTKPETFQKKLAGSEYDLGLVDLQAFGDKGLELLTTIQEIRPKLPVLILSQNPSVQIAVAALKNGAADYLLKTPADLERLPQLLQALYRQTGKTPPTPADKEPSGAGISQHGHELHTLYETLLEVNSQKNLDQLLLSIVMRSANMLEAQMGGLYLVRADGQSLELVASHNLPDDFIRTILHRGEGVSGRILQTGKPLMIEDYAHWSGKSKTYNHINSRRVLGLPLKIGERMIGVIIVADDLNVEPFDEDEILLASLFADQAAIAIENARLYEAGQREIKDRILAEQALQEIQIQLANRVGELEQRTREITYLSQFSNLLQLSLLPGEAYSIVSQYAAQLFPNSAGALFTFDEEQQDFEPRTVWGQPLPRVSSLEHDDCWALRRNRPYLATDTGIGMLCQHISIPLPGSTLCVPILSDGQETGLFYLQMEAGQQALTYEHQQLASAFAEQTGLALSNLQLREYLRNQATIDPMTGLFNRYYLQEYLEMKIHLAKQEGKRVNVILIDLDNFKAINEKFDYSTGDEFLRKFGALVKQTAEKAGIASRYVGDALVMVLTDSTLLESKRKSEHLRREIKKLIVQHEDHYLQNLTVSIGIACFPEHGHSVSELLKVAFKAALRAKEQGGDQIVIGTLREPEQPY